MRWLIAKLLNLFWYVNEPVMLMVRATPSTCLQVLATAARPSTQRLHLRSVFTSGRRYEIEPTVEGFQLTTTSKVSWSYRRRTTSGTVVNGALIMVDDEITRVQLRAHVSILRLINVLFVPAFIASIILFVPWNPYVIAAILAAMLTLSWAAHRNNAALEANEMIYFIEKALADLTPAEIMPLHADSPGVFYDFKKEWEKFYQEHQND